MSDWKSAQKWELNWHSNCVNSFHEEEKQLVYAEKMGLVRKPTPKTPYNFDLEGKNILDIGGGAYSLLLKCVDYSMCCVADPLMDKYPEWVILRYKEAFISPLAIKGEDILKHNFGSVVFDEVWIYNVLEHCENPEKVIKNARKLGKIVRLFEWVETRINEGHIHSLSVLDLNKWLGGDGKVELIKRGGAVGKAYYGIFKGDDYASSSSE